MRQAIFSNPLSPFFMLFQSDTGYFSLQKVGCIQGASLDFFYRL